MGPPKAMNGGGSSSSGGASSSSAPAPLDVDAFPDALSFPDTPDTPPGHDGFPGFEPPPEVWEEVGAKKKAKKMAAAARKDAPPAPASPPASTASTAQGKKPAVPASFAAPEGKGKGKAPASPPIAAPPSPNAAVNARATSAAAEPGSNKKPKKPVGVLPKAELQSRCEAILANGSATGFMVLDKYAASFAADMGITSWDDKYGKAHGGLRTFLARCPNLSVATVEGEDRVYLNKALDAGARSAIAAEKAAARAATPRKRKGSNQRGGCCRLLLEPAVLLFLATAFSGVVIAGLLVLVPSEEWHGALEAAKRGDGEVTLAFGRRALATLMQWASARSEPLVAGGAARWREVVATAASLRS